MKNKLSSYDYSQAERNLISGSPEIRYQIKQELSTKRARLDYFMSRFLEDHPDFQDVDNKRKFYNDKSDEYAKINRLLRIADAYS